MTRKSICVCGCVCLCVFCFCVCVFACVCVCVWSVSVSVLVCVCVCVYVCVYVKTYFKLSCVYVKIISNYLLTCSWQGSAEISFHTLTFSSFHTYTEEIVEISFHTYTIRKWSRSFSENAMTSSIRTKADHLTRCPLMLYPSVK